MAQRVRRQPREGVLGRLLDRVPAQLREHAHKHPQRVFGHSHPDAQRAREVAERGDHEIVAL